MMRIALHIGGRPFEGQSVVGREAVGSHFRIAVSVIGTDDQPVDLVGKDFELKLTPVRSPPLTITGIVVAASSSYGSSTHQLDLELGPEAELLQHGQSSRVYLDKTSKDIATDVIDRAGVGAATWHITAPPSRPYTAQYREDDWTFVDRLTREDGMYSFYDHAEGGTKLVFADDSAKATAVDGTFHHRTHHGIVATEKWVTGLSSRASSVPGAFVTRDRDPLKPKLALSARAADGAEDLEVYAWPARAITDGALRARAKTSLESLRARHVVVMGTSESTELRCGKLFEIEERTLPAALCKLFCIAVGWTMHMDGAFTLEFTAVPSTVRFRLPLQPGARAPLGVETAIVRGASGHEIDADEHGRVFAQPVWDREGKKDDSCSIRSRVGQSALVRSMAIPRVGWGMLVGHHDGDVDRPWVMSRFVDGTHPPPYKLPDNMTETSWQTLTSPHDATISEVVFEDKAGSEQVRVHAARDMTVEVGDNETRTVGNRHVLEVTADRTVTIDADEKLTVTKDQKTTVKGAESTTIDGSRSITIKGKEEASIGGDRTEKTKADRTTDIGKKRTLTVSGTMSATTKKSLTREILKKLSVTAGGAWSTQTDAGLLMTTKGNADETIAGARTENGKAGVQTLVKGDFKDTTAAAHAVTAKGSVGESAKGKMKLTVGAALNATAPQIEIVADSEITLVCGGSTVTIKSGEISIKAPTLAVTGPLVTSNGAQVKHNA
jgi:type VI secretion system secreted protein VgrG